MPTLTPSTVQSTSASTISMQQQQSLHISYVFYVFLRYVTAPSTFCGSTAPPFFYICIFANIFVYLRLRTAVSTMPGVYICPIWPHLYNLRKDLHTTLVSTSTPACVAFTLHLKRPITCLVFKVAKSAWLHFTHQTETPPFSTFYIYIVRTFLYIYASAQLSLQCQASTYVPVWPHLYNLRKDLHITLVVSTSTPAFVAFTLRLQRPITCLVFKVAKSAWLHFTHQTEPSPFSTSIHLHFANIFVYLTMQ